MANKIKQFRYYSDGVANDSSNKKNQPSVLASGPVTSSHYVSGTVFGDIYPVLQLGIQAIPGTKFYLNNASDPIIIGNTGIYELDLAGQTEITHIRFDPESMAFIKGNVNAMLIVDVIYEDGKE